MHCIAKGESNMNKSANELKSEQVDKHIRSERLQAVSRDTARSIASFTSWMDTNEPLTLMAGTREM